MKAGSIVRIWWQRGCDWDSDRYPMGRKARIVHIQETGAAGVIGSSDSVKIEWLEGRPGIAYVVRSMVREELS